MLELASRSEAQLRRACPGEAGVISALALRSKGHWGYSSEFLDACREELTFSPEQCASGHVIVAVAAERILGFYVLTGSPPDGRLGALFVEADLIGQGLGHLLLNHALATAAERGFRSLVLDADPGAESFYARYGAETTGHVDSGSIPGRRLPQMRFRLD